MRRRSLKYETVYTAKKMSLWPLPWLLQHINAMWEGCTPVIRRQESSPRLRLAFPAHWIRKVDPILSLIPRLCHLFLCSTTWDLNAQAEVNAMLLASRAVAKLSPVLREQLVKFIA
jgi:hypothetical protein